MTAMTHLKLLLLLLWVGVAVSTVVDLHRRIYHGINCPQNERLYHVKINGTNGTHVTRCGGSLIHAQWVLTAAHCWPDQWTMNVFLGVHPGSGQRVPVTGRQIFKKKILKFFKKKNDIMLLQLDTPSGIQPVALPDCANPPEVGDVIQVAGFGGYLVDVNMMPRPDEPTHLQCANMHVVNCQCPIRSFCYLWPQSSRMCYQEPNVDTCGGDSGGGVIYNNMIYGVHVGGSTPVCTSSAVSLKVCSYIDWITQTIN